MTPSPDKTMLISKGWIQAVALVMLFGFFVMGLLAYYTYTDEPPIPAKVVDTSGNVLFTGQDITAGQEVFLKNGLMEYGSFFGHGACTDSNNGRLLESRLDAWLQSELNRFHRGISLALMLLAVLILAVEMFQVQTLNDWLVLMALLLPVGFTGSRHFAFFNESKRKN